MTRYLPVVLLLSLNVSCGKASTGGFEGDDPTQCSDGTDNDANGFIDCADQGCLGVSSCIEGDEANDCGDSVDNDMDGWTDCEDQDCWGIQGCDEADADTDADADSDADADADADSDADADVVVFINELLASNNTINADQYDEYDDWFELYNPGNTAVELAGWTVTVDLGDPNMHELPDGLVIPAEGFLLVWADANVKQGDDHVSFTLDRNGGELGLYKDDGSEMDTVRFDKQTSDVSYALTDDGGSSWRYDSSPSPGESNE